MIILTAEQAESVRGAGRNNSSLQPLFFDGRYLLPEAVLQDPDYIDQREFLAALPVEDVLIVNSDE